MSHYGDGRLRTCYLFPVNTAEFAPGSPTLDGLKHTHLLAPALSPPQSCRSPLMVVGQRLHQTASFAVEQLTAFLVVLYSVLSTIVF